MKQKGFSLLPVIFLVSLALIAAAFAVKLVLAQSAVAGGGLSHIRVFYAAEAGAEWAKAKIASEPSWFTDLPHLPPDDIAWLLSGAVGIVSMIDGASLKVVREDGRNVIYSIGYVGGNIEKSKALSIIKVQFTSPPFMQVSWKEI
jgi:hypothetical protein